MSEQRESAPASAGRAVEELADLAARVEEGHFQAFADIEEHIDARIAALRAEPSPEPQRERPAPTRIPPNHPAALAQMEYSERMRSAWEKSEQAREPQRAEPSVVERSLRLQVKSLADQRQADLIDHARREAALLDRAEQAESERKIAQGKLKDWGDWYMELSDALGICLYERPVMLQHVETLAGQRNAALAELDEATKRADQAESAFKQADAERQIAQDALWAYGEQVEALRKCAERVVNAQKQIEAQGETYPPIEYDIKQLRDAVRDLAALPTEPEGQKADAGEAREGDGKSARVARDLNMARMRSALGEMVEFTADVLRDLLEDMEGR